MNTANPPRPTASSYTSGASLTDDASLSPFPAPMREARPAAVPIPVTPLLPYHRLAHVTPSSARWWRPLVMLLTFVVTTLIVSVVAFLAYWGITSIFPEIPSPTEALEDARNPTDIAVGFGSVALLLPVVLLTMFIASGRRGTIASVFGHFRWSLMTRALTVMLPFYTVLNAADLLVDRPGDLSLPHADGRLLAAIVVAVVVVPVQAAAEEFFFRGLLPQMIGTWLRSPLWGVLVSVPLFVWGHGYDAWGLADIAVFALCAHYLTWKSGGLELSVVMHVANNLTLVLLAICSPSALHQGAVAPVSLLVSVPMTLVATAWLSRRASREYGLERFEPLLRPRETRAV